MNRIKIWPHAAVIILACAVVAGAAVFLWNKYERSASAKELPAAARIDKVEGQVGLNRSLDASASNKDWIAASPNTPISVGDRIFTRANSRTQIDFTGRNSATIDPNTSLDVLQLSQETTQVALRDGSALFDVGALPSGGSFEVATPCGAVDPQQPGVYQIGLDENGNAVATAFSGRAQIVGQNGNGVIEKGETLRFSCQGGNNAVISRVDAGQAGSIIDSYYHYRYPRTYDGRYRNYYTYLEDPYYYDPYRRDISYQYVDDYVPGVEDLDDYGNWQYLDNYGYCWHPYADAAWAPYQSGYWTTDYPFGLTWVSNEPWGYAPYHYGRWTYFSNQWFWVPAAVNTYPVYSPALVAFLPFSNSSVAWVPLGPGDPYAPLYYDPNWQPVYYTQTTVIEQPIVNLVVPGAVTVVPVQDFTRVIDRRVITTVDPQTLASVRPVLDPLTVDPLRRAAFQTREARPRIDMPPTIAQRINTPVLTREAPATPPFKKDLARALRVEPLPDRAKNQKLQLRDERSAMTDQQPGRPVAGQAPNLAAEQAREQQMADLAKQASRGDRSARQQMQELRRQQVEEQRAVRAPRVVAPPLREAQGRAQGERVGNPVRPVPPRMNPRAQPEMRPMPQPRVQQQSRPQPPVTMQPQRPPQAQPQPRAVPRIEARPQPRPQPPPARPQAQPQPRAVPRIEAKPQPRPQPPAARPQAQPQPRPQPQPQAHPQQQQQRAQPPGQKKKPPEGKQ